MKEGYVPKDQRKKIIMLSDDIRTQSGVGNMAKEIVLNSSHHFNWVNLGGALKHPEAGQGFDLSPETMKLTSFKYLTKSDLVNIEFPLTLNKFISGHITTGHIDTVGVIEKLLKSTDSWFIQIKIDKIYLKYIVHKGSICIDGISLTINQIQGNIIDLMVIPHTYQNTIIKNYSLGDSVNIEVDYIAKHLEKLKNG